MDTKVREELDAEIYSDAELEFACGFRDDGLYLEASAYPNAKGVFERSVVMNIGDDLSDGVTFVQLVAIMDMAGGLVQQVDISEEEEEEEKEEEDEEEDEEEEEEEEEEE